jgi:hypothetical protein
MTDQQSRAHVERFNAGTMTIRRRGELITDLTVAFD